MGFFKDTQIELSNGKWISVQNIKQGYSVSGHDDKVYLVTNAIVSKEKMYKVHQPQPFNDYIVNKDHELTLFDKTLARVRDIDLSYLLFLSSKEDQVTKNVYEYYKCVVCDANPLQNKREWYFDFEGVTFVGVDDCYSFTFEDLEGKVPKFRIKLKDGTITCI